MTIRGIDVQTAPHRDKVNLMISPAAQRLSKVIQTPSRMWKSGI